MTDLRVETYKTVDQIRDFAGKSYIGGWDEKSGNADKHAADMIAWNHCQHAEFHLLDGAAGEIVGIGCGDHAVAAMRSVLWNAFFHCLRHREVFCLDNVCWKAVGTHVDGQRVAVVVRLG